MDLQTLKATINLTEGHELRAFYEILVKKHQEFRKEEADKDSLATLASFTEAAGIRNTTDFHRYIEIEAYHFGSRRHGNEESNWCETVKYLASEAFETHSPRKNVHTLTSALNPDLFGEELRPENESQPQVGDHPE